MEVVLPALDPHLDCERISHSSPRRRSRSQSSVAVGIEHLPFEILELVAKYLKLEELQNAAVVSKIWLACLSPFVFNSLYVQTVRGLESFNAHRPVSFLPRLHVHNHPHTSPRGLWYASLVHHLTIDIKEFCCEACLNREMSELFGFVRLCRNLKHIRLLHTGYLGTPDLCAPYLPDVRRVSISRWRVEYNALPTDIEELSLAQCFVVDIQSQLRRMPNLRRLQLSRCTPRWTEESIVAILQQNGAHLESLSLTDDFGERWIGAINDRVLFRIASLCPNLRTLSLASVMISDAGVASLAGGGLQYLDRLEIEAGSGDGSREGTVTDFSVLTIFVTWPKLRHLKLVYVDITSEALTIIAQAAGYLQHLEIQILGGLELKDFAVLKHCSSLKKLSFKSFFSPADFSEEAKTQLLGELPFEVVLDL